MAAIAPAPPKIPSDYDPTRLYALLRDIRAYIQDVQQSSSDLRKVLGLADPSSRAAALANALAESDQVIAASRDEIAQRFEAIKRLFIDAPLVYNFFGDWVVLVETEWSRAEKAWPDTGMQADEVQARLNHLDPHLHEAVYYCGFMTIPRRLREALESLRIGQSLDFHVAFKEELPLQEDRYRVLLEISRQPLFLDNGVVDAGPGLVYRASRSHWRRSLSILMIGATVCSGFLWALAWAKLGVWLNLQNWPGKPDDWRALCIAYLFLVLGSVGHLLVNALKESRSKPAEGSFVALDDWTLWIHVREWSIVWSILYLWCGLIMLAWTHSQDWRTAFFAGYSIDSVIDLFLDRFQKLAGTEAEAVKQRLG
ncbi:MAG: hypothetical protein M3O35_22420 [Acidobacteriota bacterium]|nr:hypothetical protein [Acidobacteriota bacterium]